VGRHRRRRRPAVAVAGGGAAAGRRRRRRGAVPVRRARGVALLLVLWLTMLLAAVVGAFALTAQMEKLQGRTLSRVIVAEQAARAGVEYAMTRLVDTDPRRRWLPDGRRYEWAFAGTRVRIEAIDESGKVDLNAADVDLLARLFVA